SLFQAGARHPPRRIPPRRRGRGAAGPPAPQHGGVARLLRHAAARAAPGEPHPGTARFLRIPHLQTAGSRGRHPHGLEREPMTSEKNPLREGMSEERAVDPTALIIFGASGDLTKRKLIPAVYNLALSRLLPSGFALIGVARRPKPDFAEEMRQNVAKFSRRKPINEAAWKELAGGISYVQADHN